MKKFIIFTFSIFSVLFFSCSNNDVIDEADVEYNTLKNILTEKGDDTIWTKELENDILTYDLTDKSLTVGSNIDISSEIYNLFIKTRNPAYPELFNFGSLNSSALNDSMISSINTFLAAVAKEPYSEKNTCFEEKYIFNYVFFLNNIKSNWKSKFNIDFPTAEDYQKKEEVIETEEAEDGSLVEKKVEKTVMLPDLFETWVFGEPFINEDIIQVPVRVFVSRKYFDINLYMKNKDGYPIYNINIIKWSL